MTVTYETEMDGRIIASVDDLVTASVYGRTEADAMRALVDAVESALLDEWVSSTASSSRADHDYGHVVRVAATDGRIDVTVAWEVGAVRTVACLDGLVLHDDRTAAKAAYDTATA